MAARSTGEFVVASLSVTAVNHCMQLGFCPCGGAVFPSQRQRRIRRVRKLRSLPSANPYNLRYHSSAGSARGEDHEPQPIMDCTAFHWYLFICTFAELEREHSLVF